MAEGRYYSQVELHSIARPSSPGRLRMWIGVFDKEPATLKWSVDGARLPDSEVKPIRGLAFMPPGPKHTLTQSGVYELVVPPKSPGPSGARPQYTVEVSAEWPQRHRTGVSASRVVRPLPSEMPSDAFRVLLVSCFYEPDDSGGKAGALVAKLCRGPDRPDLVLTVGDQVYLDNPAVESMLLPTFREKKYATKFEEKYRKNWQVGFSRSIHNGYADILCAAPVAAIPDDHEYWNNYPSRSMPALASFLGARDSWRDAARDTYDYFQHGDRIDDDSSYCYSIEVAPLSFFMLDNRTFRRGTISEMHSMTSGQIAAYRAWVDRMIATPGSVPVLVTGPSLFQNTKGKLKFTDLNFADVEEYPTIMEGLLHLSSAGRTPLLLTGDVHYPRLARAQYPVGSGSRPWAPIHEVISSPASLCPNPFDKRPIAKPADEQKPPKNKSAFDIDIRGTTAPSRERKQPDWTKLPGTKVWPDRKLGIPRQQCHLADLHAFAHGREPRRALSHDRQTWDNAP